MRRHTAGGEQVDFDKLAADINKEAKEPSQRTTGSEIAHLLAAASCVSADSGFDDDTDGGHTEGQSPVARAAADSSWRPDVQFEDAEVGRAFEHALLRLNPFERKILRLRGVSL
jgi:hypothetical protein